jgi:hypothetical protein
MGGAVVLLMAVPWISLALMSRGILPGGRQWLDVGLATALVATYVGFCVGLIVASRHPRRTLVKALATSLTILVMIGILEAAAALRLVHWRLIFRTLSSEGVDYGTAYVADQRLSFRRIPGLHWSGRPASDVEASYGLLPSISRTLTFTFDRWGYRNASEMRSAEVVLLGDSYVEGWYVSDDETVAARLTARLHRPVANLAIAGYGTLQELQVLKDDALQRHPRAVAWFFFEGNDLYDDQNFENALVAVERSREEGRSSDGLTKSHGWTERSFVLNGLRRIRRGLQPLIRNEAPYWATLRTSPRHERVYFFDYNLPWTKFEEERWAVARSAFQEGVTFARAAGIHIALFYVPTKFRVFRDFIDVPSDSAMKNWDDWHQLPVHFQELCASADVPCVDLTEPLRAATARGELPYAPQDTHWSPEGHALVAAAVDAAMRQNGW